MRQLTKNALAMILLLAISFLLIIYEDLSWLSNAEIFFTINDPNQYLYLTLINLAVVHACFVLPYYVFAHNRFDRLIAIRETTHNYTFRIYLNIFLSVVTFMIAFYIFFAILISVFRSPLFSTDLFEHSPTNLSFTENPIAELCVYSVLSAIGYGLYSLVFTAIRDFIRNKYLFIVLPLVFIFISVIVLSLTTSIIVRFSRHPIHIVLMTFYFPINLTNPGMLMGHGFLSFLLAGMSYGFLLLIVHFKSLRLRALNG